MKNLKGGQNAGVEASERGEGMSSPVDEDGIRCGVTDRQREKQKCELHRWLEQPLLRFFLLLLDSLAKLLGVVAGCFLMAAVLRTVEGEAGVIAGFKCLAVTTAVGLSGIVVYVYSNRSLLELNRRLGSPPLRGSSGSLHQSAYDR